MPAGKLARLQTVQGDDPVDEATDASVGSSKTYRHSPPVRPERCVGVPSLNVEHAISLLAFGKCNGRESGQRAFGLGARSLQCRIPVAECG